LATSTGVTVSTADPLCPSLVAVIVVVPGANVVMLPDVFTVATDAFDDNNVIVRPVSTSLAALRSVTRWWRRCSWYPVSAP